MSKINTQKGIAPAIVAIIIAILAVGGGIGINQSVKKSKVEREKAELQTNATSTPQVLKISLSEQSGSGQTGMAELIAMGTSTKVIVNLTGKPSSVLQPSHIHLGTCATLGTVKYPLTNIDKGAAQTILPVTLAELINEIPLALNVHKSATAISVYTSCGDISTSTIKNQTASADKSDKDDSDDSDDSDKPIVKSVTYTNTGFSPSTITIKKGETVKFTNQSDTSMWVASDPHPTHTILSEFDEKISVGKGASYEFEFEKVGTWGYHNHFSPSKIGTVIVE